MKAKSPILFIDDLTINSQDSMLLEGLSFSVFPNEIIAIVGESGSGKSLTALSIAGLLSESKLKVSSKKMRLGKHDLSALSAKDWEEIRGKNLGMVFQEPQSSLNPSMRCGPQVMERLQKFKNDDKYTNKIRVLLSFEQVQLPDPERIFRAYPHELSGGQKQRVMIAMAMSCEPSVLIADEPTTALDVTVQKTILLLMQKLQKEKDMGIMFITHDLGVIAELADKVVVMYKGKIVEQGNVWEIFTNPQHPYTKGLLACRPPLEKRYSFLPTVSDFMKIDENGNIIDNNISVADFTKNLIISDSERQKKQKELFSKEAVLQLKNLKTYFPIKNGFFGGISSYVKAVNDVTFDVFPGETLGLVGESGCGKTTIGRTILRLEEPTEGEMIYKGQDIAKMTADELRVFRK